MKNEHKRKREKQKTLWTIAFWKTKEKINNNNQRNIRLFARDIIFLFVFALMSNRQCLYVYQVFLTIIILWFFFSSSNVPGLFFFNIIIIKCIWSLSSYLMIISCCCYCLFCQTYMTRWKTNSVERIISPVFLFSFLSFIEIIYIYFLPLYVYIPCFFFVYYCK